MIFAIVAHFLLQKLFCSKMKLVIICSNLSIIQHTQCFQTKYKIVRIFTILHRWKIRVSVFCLYRTLEVEWTQKLLLATIAYLFSWSYFDFEKYLTYDLTTWICSMDIVIFESEDECINQICKKKKRKF